MANDRDPETNPAAFLGAELRRARLAVGIKSQDKLAQMLGYDRSVIAKAETGDRVTINFKGTIEGVPFDGGTGENIQVTIGSNTFIPGFEEQLSGIGQGERHPSHPAVDVAPRPGPAFDGA